MTETKQRAKGIEAEDLFSLKSLAQPQYTKDKQFVFYIETTIHQKENNYTSEIHRLNVETKEVTVWASQGTQNTTPKISPDGQKLSFISNRGADKKPQVYVMALAGGEAIPVTSFEEGITSYQWLPNSQGVIVTTEPKEKEEEAENDFPKPIVITEMQHKADGAGFISMRQKTHFYEIDFAKNETLLFEVEERVQLGAISPDGQKLAYAKDAVPEDEKDFAQFVYVFDKGTKATTCLTAEIPKGQFTVGAFSPDGQKLLLAGNDFKHVVATQTKLYLYDFSAEKLSCLTRDLDKEVGDMMVGDFQQNVGGFSVVWRKDSASFYFPVTTWGSMQLYYGTIQGETKPVFEKELHIVDFDIDGATDEAVIAVSTPTIPSELWQVQLLADTYSVLLDPNEAALADKVVTPAEAFIFDAPDGWKVQGWYMPPVAPKNPDKVPLMLYIHGGPQVCYGFTFFHEMQMHANDGYAVLLINPRGGNGYGQEFVKAVLTDYGNKDYLDLMTGVDVTLAAHPEIDTDHLYVTGGSYGGFMTNWIVTQTKRFRAAATQRSISNWVSFYGTSDIGYYFTEWEMGAGLEDIEKLWKHSPLAYVSQAETPLLILHGEADLRCPIEQAEQFFIALKNQDVDTRFVRFPESNHNLSRTGLPSLRLARLNEITEWFKTHV